MAQAEASERAASSMVCAALADASRCAASSTVCAALADASAPAASTTVCAALADASERPAFPTAPAARAEAVPLGGLRPSTVGRPSPGREHAVAESEPSRVGGLGATDSAGRGGDHDLDSVLEHAARWKTEGLAVALATVVRTWGSSPRPAGSKLAVNDRGEFIGSISGGCIEGAVIQESLEIMSGAPPRLLHFGVTDDVAWEVGLACGGKIEIFVEALQ